MQMTPGHIVPLANSGKILKTTASRISEQIFASFTQFFGHSVSNESKRLFSKFFLSPYRKKNTFRNIRRKIHIRTYLCCLAFQWIQIDSNGLNETESSQEIKVVPKVQNFQIEIATYTVNRNIQTCQINHTMSLSLLSYRTTRPFTPATCFFITKR